HLTSLELGEEGAKVLRDATHLSELDTLSVRGLGDRGLEALVSAPHLRRLRALRVKESTISPKGVTILAQTPMERLTHLQLSGGPLGDEGVMALASSKTLPRLSSLDLSASGVTDRGAKALVES